MNSKTWRETDVPGYLINKKGEVYSHRTKKYIYPYVTGKGNLQITLGGRLYTVSHLVYRAFKGTKPFRLNYLDGNTQNVDLDNLEPTNNPKNFLGGHDEIY